jgi:hypothetical protein
MLPAEIAEIGSKLITFTTRPVIEHVSAGHWWLVFIILATQRSGESRFEASLVK